MAQTDLPKDQLDFLLFMGANANFFEDKIKDTSSLHPDVIEAIIAARDAKKTKLADDVTADELVDAIAQVASTRDRNTLRTDLDDLVTSEFKKNYGPAIVAKINTLMAAANSAAAKQPATPVAVVAQNVSRQATAGAALPATQPIKPVEPPEVDAEKTHNGDEPPEAESERTLHGDLPEEDSERTIHGNLAPEESAESSEPLVPVETGAIVSSSVLGKTNEPEDEAETTAEETNPDDGRPAALEAEKFDVEAAIARMLKIEAFNTDAITRLKQSESEVQLYNLANILKGSAKPNYVFNDGWKGENSELFDKSKNATNHFLNILGLEENEENLSKVLKDGQLDENKRKNILPGLNTSTYQSLIARLILIGLSEIGEADGSKLSLRDARSALVKVIGNAHAAEVCSRFSFKYIVEYYDQTVVGNYFINSIIVAGQEIPGSLNEKARKALKDIAIKSNNNIRFFGNGNICEVTDVGRKDLKGNPELLSANNAITSGDKFGTPTAQKVNDTLTPVQWVDNQVREGIVCVAAPGADGKYESGEIRVASTYESGGYVLIRKDGSVQKTADGKAQLLGKGKAAHLSSDPTKRQRAAVAAEKVPVAGYSHVLFLSQEQYDKIANTQPNSGETDLEKINRILDRKKITALDIESYTQKLDELNVASDAADDAKTRLESEAKFDPRKAATEMFKGVDDKWFEGIGKRIGIDEATSEADLYVRYNEVHNSARDCTQEWGNKHLELADLRNKGVEALSSVLSVTPDTLDQVLAQGTAPVEHQAQIAQYFKYSENDDYQWTLGALAVLGDPTVFNDGVDGKKITKALQKAVGDENAAKITNRISYQVFLREFPRRMYSRLSGSIAMALLDRQFLEKKYPTKYLNDDSGLKRGISPNARDSDGRTLLVDNFELSEVGSRALMMALTQDGKNEVDLKWLSKNPDARQVSVNALYDQRQQLEWLLNGSPLEGIILQSQANVDGTEQLYIFGVTDGARLVILKHDKTFETFRGKPEVVLGNSTTGTMTMESTEFHPRYGEEKFIIVSKNFDITQLENLNLDDDSTELPVGVLAILDLKKYYEAMHPTPQAEPTTAAPGESDDNDDPAPADFPDSADNLPTQALVDRLFGSPQAPQAPRIDLDTPVPEPVPAPTPLRAVRMPAAASTPTPLHAVRIPAATRAEAESGEPVAEKAFFETSEDDIKKRNTDRIVIDEDSDVLVPAELPRSGFGRKLALAGALLAGVGAGTYGYEKYDAGKTDHVNLATGVTDEVDAIQKPKLMRDTVFGLGSNETIASLPKSFEITVHDFTLDDQKVVQLTDVDFTPTTEGEKLNMEALKTQLSRHGLTRDNKVFMEFADSKTGALQNFISQENFKPGAKGDQRLTMKALNAGEMLTVPRKVIPNTLFKIKFNQDGPEFVDDPISHLPATKAKLGETLAWKYKGINLDDAGTKTDQSGVASMRSVFLREAINALPNSKKVVGSTCQVEVPIVIFQTLVQQDNTKKDTPPTPPSQTK